MPVYVDVLLVTNYIVNLLLLYCHAKFAGRRPRRLRMVLAALVGAVGSLSIFLPVQGFWAGLGYKLLLSAAMMCIARKGGGLRAFVKDWLLFFTVSFLFAGAMLALWMPLRPKSMLYYNGIVYFDISAVTLLVATTAAYLLASLFWRFARDGRIGDSARAVILRFQGREAKLSAMVDSGNRLTEPFSGSPAAVCRLEALRPLLSPEAFGALEREDYEKAGEFGMKLRFIPYNVINGSGILPAFRPDALLLETPAGDCAGGEAWIAVFRGEMSCDALLNPDIAAHEADTPGRVLLKI